MSSEPEVFELTAPPVAPPKVTRAIPFTQLTARLIRRGQHVDPHDWNASCGRDDSQRLHVPCVVREVFPETRVQTNVQLEVRTLGGGLRRISAAWFRPWRPGVTP